MVVFLVFDDKCLFKLLILNKINQIIACCGT
jgi:hypothetical protein